MRVTSVSLVPGAHERPGRHASRAMPSMPPDQTKEEAPPVPEPDKGLHFDAWA